MQIYLDNSSTTIPNSAVIDEVTSNLRECFGNPSSIHKIGIEAEKIIKKSRSTLADALGDAKPKEIVFTSCGTESNNMAIRGALSANKRAGKHIISSFSEHDSVYKTLEDLQQREDYKVTFLKPNKDGIITADQVKNALKEDTIFVSLMHVNNEIGAINPINEIGQVIKSYKQSIVYHVDAVQSFLKLKINLENIDLLSISGHKVHAPKGIGALYIREKTKIHPLLTGGGQEMQFRSGTENTAYIAGLSKAIDIQKGSLSEDLNRIKKLREKFILNLNSEIRDIVVNSSESSLPYICNISFLGVKGEILLHTLEQNAIFVSTGSACSSKKKGSRVLESLDLSLGIKDSAIRFSFSKNTTDDELQFTVEVLKKEITKLRKLLNYK